MIAFLICLQKMVSTSRIAAGLLSNSVQILLVNEKSIVFRLRQKNDITMKDL
jgi:hypothetical protein